MIRSSFSFVKVKVISKDSKTKQLEILQEDKIKVSNSKSCTDNVKRNKIEEIETEMAEVLKDIQTKKHEKDLKHLKELKSNKGKAAAIFSLRDKVLGMKKSSQEQVAVINPVTGHYVYTAEEIKQVSLDYCVNLLTKKEQKEEVERISGI